MSPYPTPSLLFSRLRACLYRSSFPLPSLVIHHRSFASQSPSSDSAPVPSPSPDSGFGLRAEPRSSSSKQKSSRKNQGYGLASKSSESNLSSSSPSSTRSTSLSSSSGSTSSNRPSKNSSSKRNSSSPSPLSSSYPSSAASFVRPPSSHPSQPRPKSYLPHSTVSPSPSPTTAFTHSSYHTLDGLPRPEVIYAVSHEEANEALGRLQGPVLALDVEWNSGMQEGEKLSPTAVIQVGDGMFCVVVHASLMNYQLPSKLVSLLTNPRIIKTGISLQSDIHRLTKDFSVVATPIVDLHSISPFIPSLSGKINPNTGKLYMIGLKAFTERYLGVTLVKDKQLTLGAWDRALSPLQIAYAATDVHVTFKLFYALRKLALSGSFAKDWPLPPVPSPPFSSPPNASLPSTSEDAGKLMRQRVFNWETLKIREVEAGVAGRGGGSS